MIIHVYTMCYNEEVLMPYFLRHYGSFADQIFVFDHYSTDKTMKIVSGCKKAVCRPFGIEGVYDDSVLINLKNEEYKESRGKADWVIVVDTDEFVYHTNLISVLSDYTKRGITFPKISGYDMIGDEVPKVDMQIYEIIKTGVFDKQYSKRAIFDPSIEINYYKGAHNCSPKGKVVESQEAEIKILHYRCLSREFFVNRIIERTKRLSEDNIKNGSSVIKIGKNENLQDNLLLSYAEKKSRRVVVL